MVKPGEVSSVLSVVSVDPVLVVDPRLELVVDPSVVVEVVDPEVVVEGRVLVVTIGRVVVVDGRVVVVVVAGRVVVVVEEVGICAPAGAIQPANGRTRPTRSSPAPINLRGEQVFDTVDL